MTRILSDLNLKHVDIWILDVEGAEEQALLGVDFSEINFSAIVMECDDHGEGTGKNERARKMLKIRGYDCQRLLRNCFCKNHKYTEVGLPSSALPFQLRLVNGTAIASISTHKSFFLAVNGIRRRFGNYDTYTDYLNKGGLPYRIIPDNVMGMFRDGPDISSVRV